MELYIIRHGETVWNKERRLQGRTDIVLSENGIDLAIKTGEALALVDIEVIYSSPLSRAYDTAVYIRGSRDIPIIEDDRIREMSFGAYEGMKESELEDTSFKYFFCDPCKYTPSDEGETFEEVCVRAEAFMIDLMHKYGHTDKRIMIVAHGAMNKAIMMYVKKHPLSEFWKPDLQKNCSAIIVRYEDEQFNIIDECKCFWQ